VAQTGKTDDLLNGILLEAVRNKHFFNSSPLSTLYIGGGSPGILAADKISSFVNQLGDIYDLSRLQEFTVELNPEDAVPDFEVPGLIVSVLAYNRPTTNIYFF